MHTSTNCNNNSILHFILCAIIDRKHLNILLQCSNCNRLLDILFLNDCLWKTSMHKWLSFALQKLIAITIVFHKSYQCAIMSDINWNITIHGSICSRLLRHLILYWLLMINMNSQIIPEINRNQNCILPMRH